MGMQTLIHPTVLEFVSDVESPLSVFQRICHAQPNAFLFESSATGDRLARFSIVACDPIERFIVKNNVLSLVGTGAAPVFLPVTDPLSVMAERMEHISRCYVQEGIPEFIPFSAGYAGYLGYGATAYFDRIDRQSKDTLAIPEASFGFYDSAIVFDHLHRRMYVISYRSKEHAHVLKELIFAEKERSLGPLNIASCDMDLEQLFARIDSSMSKAEFMDAVRRCQEFIAEGQAFQIVLSQRFSRPVKTSALNIYRLLQSINPSAYAYFLRYPEFSYLGSSPETLLTCRAQELSLQVLAGTRKREGGKQDDLAAAELKVNEKELAEHYMLVDLGRNDLGRVSVTGSVAVSEIARVERYSHVMHLSTSISAKLRPELTCFDAVRGCFPAGTVSGAPKIRAMQLLSGLETEQRGIYSGMVGYFNINGDCDAALAIRSALIKDGTAHVNAGAGIVMDSDAEFEYEETRNKARSVLAAIRLAELTEK